MAAPAPLTPRDNLLWFFENEDPRNGLRFGIAVKDVLLSTRTDYQQLQVLDTPGFGRVMVLDGCVMITQRDEFIYHEMIAHIPMFAHPEPRAVLVVGGGDGGTLREVLRHPSVERAVLCEIDGGVVQAAKDFFPEVAVGFEDPRAEVIIGDAIDYVAHQESAFDVILVDSTDPIGPGVGLFTKEFYESVHRALTPNGIVVAQGESPYLYPEVVAAIHEKLAATFPFRTMYQAMIPTYPSGWWSFAFASKGLDPLAPEALTRAEAAALACRYYTPGIHRAAFELPPCVREHLPE